MGANHGLFSLLAVYHGACATALDAQRSLAQLVDAAALANGVGDRVRVFHNAALDVPRVVQIPELALSLINEGGTARLGDMTRGVPMMDVETVSVYMTAQSEWPGHKPSAEVAFLNVDVEGNELPAMRSAIGLFERRKIRHSNVEFGPIMDWESAARSGVAGSNREAAYDILQKLRNFGYTASVDLLRACNCTNPALGAKLKGTSQSGLLIEPEPRNLEECAQACLTELAHHGLVEIGLIVLEEAGDTKITAWCRWVGDSPGNQKVSVSLKCAKTGQMRIEDMQTILRQMSS